jgi:two-component system response regulator TctD
MRLLLIEDNETLSALLQRGLSTRGFAVDVVSTVANALNGLAMTRFSVIILDLGLPDGDGYDVLQFLRGKGDSTPVLILTARSAVDDRVKGFQRGADDYLCKPFALEELVARVHALLRRPGILLGAALQLGHLTFDTASREVSVDGCPQFIAPREVAVLEALLRRSGRVVPKQVIEDQLYGLSCEVSSNAVEVYVHRLRKQLSDADAGIEIHTIRGVGYLVRETA